MVHDDAGREVRMIRRGDAATRRRAHVGATAPWDARRGVDYNGGSVSAVSGAGGGGARAWVTLAASASRARAKNPRAS